MKDARGKKLEIGDTVLHPLFGLCTITSLRKRYTAKEGRKEEKIKIDLIDGCNKSGNFFLGYDQDLVITVGIKKVKA